MVLKLGGFAFPSPPRADTVKAYADLISKLRSHGHSLVVVTGGGSSARVFMEAARACGASQVVCDQIGIHATRLNARLLRAALREEAYPGIPESIEDLERAFSSWKIVTMGGLQPGHSTNAVAAIAAETIGADMLINITDVLGVHTRDPKKDDQAKKLDEISIRGLSQILAEEKFNAGEYKLMDPVALMIIERSRIPTWIVPGDDPNNVLAVLAEKKIGTRITFGSG